jgi:hypothetical protein
MFTTSTIQVLCFNIILVLVVVPGKPVLWNEGRYEELDQLDGPLCLVSNYPHPEFCAPFLAPRFFNIAWPPNSERTAGCTN